MDSHMNSKLGAASKVETDPGSPYQGGGWSGRGLGGWGWVGGWGGLKQEMCFTGNRKVVSVFGQSCILKELLSGR